jgi:hypothetical protein
MQLLTTVSQKLLAARYNTTKLALLGRPIGATTLSIMTLYLTAIFDVTLSISMLDMTQLNDTQNNGTEQAWAIQMNCTSDATVILALPKSQKSVLGSFSYLLGKKILSNFFTDILPMRITVR